MDPVVLKQIMSLVNDAHTIIVSSVDENGYPNSKQMFKKIHNGLEKFWFSTNTSSIRTRQFLTNQKACLYFVGESNGLMLIGEMKVCTDNESRRMLWNEGDEKYYSLGVDDPDYCVYEFTSESGNYYFNLEKHIFNIEELIEGAISSM
ncbi:pyridoxamine 5'-phosphate oxidase family protein [Paenibacillus sp. N3/727]|uniref:pyridoxamine 5'-phosphate oxidase family protein n=1 Tax=Paenibacillus sp. N3/727 TaxID=2925845 RepID=UPI001F52F6E3|nr:pyridoxamine 5'-phosphate oxidase family protein [Paenibacillus sp. N3/727]UNK16146.1 pyridoxamine 5'-phosphate oxidase family protein [Paenibacillus sp. N3/727]